MKLQEKWCFSVNDDNKLLDIFLDFGETMLSAGGEISRVEDSIARMGRAYGATRTNVFIIPSSIELTITFADGDTVTPTRRIRTSPSTDFQKLQATLKKFFEKFFKYIQPMGFSFPLIIRTPAKNKK